MHRKMRCRSCRRMGDAHMAKMNGGRCPMCGGGFFDWVVKGINHFFANKPNTPGVSNFPGAQGSNALHKQLGDINREWRERQQPLFTTLNRPETHFSGRGMSVAEFKKLPMGMQKKILDKFLKREHVKPDQVMGGSLMGGWSIGELLHKILRSVLSKDFVQFLDQLSDYSYGVKPGPSMYADRGHVQPPPYGNFSHRGHLTGFGRKMRRKRCTDCGVLNRPHMVLKRGGCRACGGGFWGDLWNQVKKYISGPKYSDVTRFPPASHYQYHTPSYMSLDFM